jgi:enoyl-[acyl-carrier-protein] reductase (NADH)
MRRMVTLDEVAHAAQFLCSRASGGIVGHTLVVDGGVRVVD